ncbi:putative galacturonosyltransferase 14 [Hordeum vulgare]|nr:putative galacturonosyltransferase 14 [Hordeum vulgare]
MRADDYVVGAANVFDEMDASDDLHDATAEFVHLLDDNTVDIHQASFGDYSYDELDDGLHGHDKEEYGVEEVDRGVRPRASKSSRKIKERHAFGR